MRPLLLVFHRQFNRYNGICNHNAHFSVKRPSNTTEVAHVLLFSSYITCIHGPGMAFGAIVAFMMGLFNSTTYSRWWTVRYLCCLCYCVQLRRHFRTMIGPNSVIHFLSSENPIPPASRDVQIRDKLGLVIGRSVNIAMLISTYIPGMSAAAVEAREELVSSFSVLEFLWPHRSFLPVV